MGQNLSTPSDERKDDSIKKLSYLWKFIKPDWLIVLTGVVLYGLIGTTYPIIGALMANVNVVSRTNLTKDMINSNDSFFFDR